MKPETTPARSGVAATETQARLAPARRWPWVRDGRVSDDARWLDDADEAQTRVDAWVPIVLAMILVTAFLARLSAAEHLSPHIDEPASVMAAHMVAERGLPIFPSDIPYFQGATLSYVLAPLVALGYGDLDDLYLMRLLSVVVSLATVYVVYRIGRELTAEAWPGVVAAALLAVDPVSIRWSGHVRMYAPLQFFAALLIWLFLRAILRGPSARLLAGIVAVFWLGVFTHIAIALMWPAMALVTLAVHGRRLRGERRDMALALALCLAAPATLFGINKLLGPSDRAVSQTVPFLSFVGDHLLSISRLWKPTFLAWEELFLNSTLDDVMPFVVVALSSLLAGRYFLTRLRPEESAARRGVGTVLLFYWMPVLLVGLFTNEPQERYVIHVQPLGFLLMALALRELVARRETFAALERWQIRVFQSAGAFVLVVVLVHLGSGIYNLTKMTVGDPNYVDGAAYIAARRDPGERVIVALPPPAYLALGGNEDMLFLPGPWESRRTDRYTRQVGEGEFIDYWAGVPAIVTTDGLCQTLLDGGDDLWLLIDNQRLYAHWAYGGDMSTVLTGLTYVTYAGPGGVEVRRVSPVVSRNTRAERLCQRVAELPPPWELAEQEAAR